ncbi:hypothetical protein D6851_11055 [Altericroceibacterium spongiae]|uniref:O-antigen ligase domain-containing protein n=1 Tax=Altericroceibacterium spongiae TaxID=2320269 RepID=A0A420EIV8_9SPHN|nr:hypothetical protein D6851_11055 [Altericroceibacterium spongiae]
MRLVLLFLLLLPIEGILRKWLLNPWQQPLILLRDPVVLALLVTHIMDNRSCLPRWLLLWMFAVAGLLLFGAIQIIAGDASLAAFLYGLRITMLFIPVSFVMRDVFLIEDWRRLIQLCCWLSLPMAVLVIWQYHAPVSALINRGVSDDPEAYVFQVVRGVVRPYGVFPFVTPQSAFCVMLAALFLAAWDRRKLWTIPIAPLTIGTASLVVMTVLSGSRTVFFGVAMVGIIYGLGGLIFAGPVRMAGRLTGMGLTAAILAVTVSLLFPNALSDMAARQQEAFISEGSALHRAVMILSPFPPDGLAPDLVGQGLGAGSNAGGFLIKGARGFTLSEYEVARVLQEAGLLVGSLMLAFRGAVIVWGLGRAAYIAYWNGSAASFSLIGAVGMQFFIFQLSGQNQIASIGWFSCGLLFCCLRFSDRNDPAGEPDHSLGADHRARMAVRAVSASRTER